MSTLETLPLEVQYYIVRLLPVSSVSALARSSRCLHLNLGPEVYPLAASHECSHFFLWRCIQKRNAQAFKRLLSGGASLTAPPKPQEVLDMSELIAPKVVYYLVCQGGTTLLHSAARAGDAVIASILLERGFEIYSGDSDHATCLEYAAKRPRNTAVIKLLLDEGTAKLGADHVLEFLEEAITEAAERYCVDNLELMLEYRRRHTRRGLNFGLYGMFYSWTPDDDGARVVRMLLENGAYIDQCPTTFGPLIEAAQYGLLEVTRVLIEYGANANSTCRGDDGATVTPLLEVAKLASLGTEDMYRHLRFDRELITEDYVKRWIAEKAQPAECIAKILMESGADPELAISLVDSSMAVSSEGREACKGFLTNLGPRSEGGEKPGAT